MNPSHVLPVILAVRYMTVTKRILGVRFESICQTVGLWPCATTSQPPDVFEL